MESFTLCNLTFSYPESKTPVLKNLNLSFKQGQFTALCGPSGCGKTTLLRQLKPVLAPRGSLSGEILFEGVPILDLESRVQNSKIGFVMQSPENQIVTDKVWHELAFGLESFGLNTETIRLRVAEMASFFGIESWFHKSVTELSGGQKQLLNLASIMAMHPSVLILDEPTSQLDPIAAADFLATIGKINRELGTTIIITEHRLEEVLPLADRVLVMDEGTLICDDTPAKAGAKLKAYGHSMFLAMPAPMRVYASVPSELPCPITVRDGREWLNQWTSENGDLIVNFSNTEAFHKDPVVELDEVWFRYEKKDADILKGLSCKVYKGELLTILGGNGVGKSTMLSIMSGRKNPYRGGVKINGIPIGKVENLYSGLLGVLPQNPQALFLKKTVREDLMEMLTERGLSKEQKENKLKRVAATCRLESLLHMHPYDLSGGEQQRAALAKVLLTEPKILMLDEPTKGFDAEFKLSFAEILNELMAGGTTIILVSHDVEFCARYAHRCAMMFDGMIISVDTPRKFFAGNSFYTTSANRMARHLLPEAITAEDLISACGGACSEDKFKLKTKTPPETHDDSDDKPFPIPSKKPAPKTPSEQRTLTKRTLTAVAMILLVIPLTIFIGIHYLNDRQYYLISMMIIFETMFPFFMIFENKKPQARELVIISVMCALGVAGRVAFFMLPQFKPVIAIAIITGLAFGGEAGFLVGAASGFVSNFFYGQGPWAPMQMLAFGMIGFLGGILFRKGILRRSCVALCTFGGLATFLIYGGIMNSAAVLIFQGAPTKEMFITAYLMGIPFDLIHAASTVFFLWIISGPMLEKLDRIKLKYGLLES